MKTHRIGLLLGLVFGGLIMIVTSQSAYAGTSLTCWSRQCAYDYAYSARYEYYRMTHEEWYDDNVNTTPNLKPNATKLPYDDHIEGVDCSGLVYKAWALTGTTGNYQTFTCYKTTEKVSSRYKATHFFDGCAGACTIVCGKPKSGSTWPTTCKNWKPEMMDAYAVLKGTSPLYSVDHVGLIFEALSEGRDRTLEAFNDKKIYDFKTITWRSDAAFRGLVRKNWKSNSTCSCSTACRPSPPAAP